LGRVIARSFRLIGQRPLSLIAITLLFSTVPAIAMTWARAMVTVHVTLPAAQGAPAPPAGDLGALFAQLGVIEAVTILIGGLEWVAQGAVASALLGGEGQAYRPGEVVARVAARLAPLYLLGVLSTLGILGGTLLLIVPGILLALAWTVGAQVAALEKRSFLGVFRRSAELTRNHRGMLFVLALIYGVLSYALTFGERMAFGQGLVRTGAEPLLLTYGVQPLVTSALALLLGAVNASVYVELAELKDGAVMHQVAATFA
jgi:hypothetical protein